VQEQARPRRQARRWDSALASDVVDAINGDRLVDGQHPFSITRSCSASAIVRRWPKKTSSSAGVPSARRTTRLSTALAVCSEPHDSAALRARLHVAIGATGLADADRFWIEDSERAFRTTFWRAVRRIHVGLRRNAPQYRAPGSPSAGTCSKMGNSHIDTAVEEGTRSRSASSCRSAQGCREGAAPG
jgi:hypothetical protein